MSWVDTLSTVVINGRKFVAASFRGVPFFVAKSERTGGRRTVTQEFPGREQPFIEDLGRKAGAFHVEAYVVGDDYVAQRNALREALEETAGPGQLVHPYYGIVAAICTQLSISETRSGGRMATFGIEFAHAPAQAPVPTVVADGKSAVATRADAAVAATKAEMAEQYDVSHLPAFAVESASAALSRASLFLQTKLAPVITSTEELASLNGKVTVLTAQASSLARQPADVLLDAFRSTITGLADTVVAAPTAVFDALVAAYDVDMGDLVPTSTSTRERELANQLAIQAALRRVIAAEAARLAPVAPYASIDDATAARDRVAALLDDQASVAGDTAYPALVALRSEVLRAVPGSRVFARVVTVTRTAPIPSLLLTYQLYGSVDAEADVIARNHISHPGVIAGELRVLSDA